jgi:3-oxoadipate enol-lactonase
VAGGLNDVDATTVLLHPIGLDGDSFQFVGALLGRGAVAYDLLWHGSRPEPIGSITLEAMADDVAEHTTGRLDVVGVSLGGAVAQYLALRHPQRVRSLVLAASTAGDGAPERMHEFEQRARQVTEQGMDGITDWAIGRWFSERVRANADHPAIRYVRDRLHRDDPRSFAAAWLALGANAALPRLGEIRAPTTLVHPEHDVSPLAAKERMEQAMSRARIRVVDGPHMVHLEAPEGFVDAVGEHLEWVAGL